MAQRIHQSKFGYDDDEKSPVADLENNGNNKEASRYTNNDGYTRSIDPMDGAMKELLEMCKQFSDELSVEGDEEDSFISSQDSQINNSSSRKQVHKNTANYQRKKCDSNNLNSKNKTSDEAAASSQNSIQALQQKQTQIQALLDDALNTAKKLESRSQRRKCQLDEQIENQEATIKISDDNDEEYDDELLEFQKIESELRISDLNRQLNVIQESLRMKLYRRLLFNTNVRKRTSPNIPETNQDSTLTTHDSCQDDTSPPSSSCSDETGASSVSTSNSYSNVLKTATTTSTPATNSIDKTDGLLSRKEQQPASNGTVETKRNDHVLKTTQAPKDNDCNDQTITKEEEPSTNNSASDNYSPETPTAGRDSGLSSSGGRSTSTDEPSVQYSNAETSCSSQSTLANTGQVMYTSSPTCFAYHRNSSANSDLERIEEDEEDMQGFDSGSPNHFRMIYEEKIAPIIRGSGGKNTVKAANQSNYYQPVAAHSDLGFISGNTSDLGCESGLDSSRSKQYPLAVAAAAAAAVSGIEEVAMEIDKKESLVTSLVGNANTRQQQQRLQQMDGKPPASWSTNRPLTLYLPKPNERIDLVEHIQALGHDLNAIADDISIQSSYACGYLRKQSLNNNRRWSKKYFHFDRATKTLCYHENEASFLKKKSVPRKNCIPFDNIYDVYVDHIRSGIGKKDLKSSKHYYIFVLSTAERKYSLASHRTDTMRAWIDILFTAAQVNEYFE